MEMENDLEKVSVEYVLIYSEPPDHRGALQELGEVDPIDNDPVADFVKTQMYGDLGLTKQGRAADRLDAQLAKFFLGHPEELEEARALMTDLRTSLQKELVLTR
jgi:hypothetical protein